MLLVVKIYSIACYMLLFCVSKRYFCEPVVLGECGHCFCRQCFFLHLLHKETCAICSVPVCKSNCVKATRLANIVALIDQLLGEQDNGPTKCTPEMQLQCKEDCFLAAESSCPIQSQTTPLNAVHEAETAPRNATRKRTSTAAKGAKLAAKKTERLKVFKKELPPTRRSKKGAVTTRRTAADPEWLRLCNSGALPHDARLEYRGQCATVSNDGSVKDSVSLKRYADPAQWAVGAYEDSTGICKVVNWANDVVCDGAPLRSFFEAAVPLSPVSELASGMEAKLSVMGTVCAALSTVFYIVCSNLSDLDEVRLFLF